MALLIFGDRIPDAVVVEEEGRLLSATRRSEDGVSEFRKLVARASLDLDEASIADHSDDIAHFHQVTPIELKQREGRVQEARIVVSDVRP